MPCQISELGAVYVIPGRAGGLAAIEALHSSFDAMTES